MFTHTLTIVLESGGESFRTQRSFSGSGHVGLREEIENAQTDKNVFCAIDVSAVKSFYVYASRALTIETNDGSSPDDTITLAAGEEYFWNTDSQESFKLTADVTALKLTNASGGTADFILDCVLDATP